MPQYYRVYNTVSLLVQSTDSSGHTTPYYTLLHPTPGYSRLLQATPSLSNGHTPTILTVLHGSPPQATHACPECTTTLFSIVHYSQCSAVQCSIVQYIEVQCSAVKYSAVQYSIDVVFMRQESTLWYLKPSPAWGQYFTVQYSTVL